MCPKLSSAPFTGYPQPKLLCPPNIVTELPPNRTTVRIRIAKPKTDVNWDRDVHAEPIWAKTLDFDLNIGKRSFKFSAKHPLSKLTTSCNVDITVLGMVENDGFWVRNVSVNHCVFAAGEPPTVKHCPESQSHSLKLYDDSIEILWIEPIFSDNVNVTNISRTNVGFCDRSNYHQ